MDTMSLLEIMMIYTDHFIIIIDYNFHTVDFAPAYRISQSLMPFVCISTEKRNSMLINRVEMLVDHIDRNLCLIENFLFNFFRCDNTE